MAKGQDNPTSKQGEAPPALESSLLIYRWRIQPISLFYFLSEHLKPAFQLFEMADTQRLTREMAEKVMGDLSRRLGYFLVPLDWIIAFCGGRPPGLPLGDKGMVADPGDNWVA